MPVMSVRQHSLLVYLRRPICRLTRSASLSYVNVDLQIFELFIVTIESDVFPALFVGCPSLIDVSRLVCFTVHFQDLRYDRTR